MIVLGFDTATPATAIGLWLADGGATQARDDPPPGVRPGHATRLLPLAARLLAEAGLGWSDLERIAVGLGPGTFTGLRIGVATARGLACSLGVELVGVSSLRALALPAARADAEPEERVLAVLDARRGEVFVAEYAATNAELAPARALAPAGLAELVARDHGPWLAVGDGVVRYREQLRAALSSNVRVPEDGSPLHRISGAAICELAVGAPVGAIDTVLPDYRRRPDAEIALELGVVR